MDIYVALCDDYVTNSVLIGTFSTEEKAQDACQEHDDEWRKGFRLEPRPLAWVNGESDARALRYAIVLTGLDERNQ